MLLVSPLLCASLALFAGLGQADDSADLWALQGLMMEIRGFDDQNDQQILTSLREVVEGMNGNLENTQKLISLLDGQFPELDSQQLQHLADTFQEFHGTKLLSVIIDVLNYYDLHQD